MSLSDGYECNYSYDYSMSFLLSQGECEIFRGCCEKLPASCRGKTEEARKASEQTVLDIDDLDNVATPER